MSTCFVIIKMLTNEDEGRHGNDEDHNILMMMVMMMVMMILISCGKRNSLSLRGRRQAEINQISGCLS